MTQIEKQLLLKDIAARVPYGVKCQTKNGIGTLISIECSFGENLAYVDFGHPEVEEYDLNDGDTVKPYLRPMSSMTEEEKNELGNFVAAEMFASQSKDPLFQLTRKALFADFFNKHHIDYRGFIEDGFALEAKEGMYE